MIFIKFDANGKMSSYAIADRVEDIKPNGEGFESLSATFNERDIFYLKKKDGVIVIDQEQKSADQLREINNNRIAEIKLRLNALSQDLVQDIAGEIVPNIDERKQEFIALHNEIREYEGKAKREINTEVL